MENVSQTGAICIDFVDIPATECSVALTDLLPFLCLSFVVFIIIIISLYFELKKKKIIYFHLKNPEGLCKRNNSGFL